MSQSRPSKRYFAVVKHRDVARLELALEIYDEDFEQFTADERSEGARYVRIQQPTTTNKEIWDEVNNPADDLVLFESKSDAEDYVKANAYFRKLTDTQKQNVRLDPQPVKMQPIIEISTNEDLGQTENYKIHNADIKANGEEYFTPENKAEYPAFTLHSNNPGKIYVHAAWLNNKSLDIRPVAPQSYNTFFPAPKASVYNRIDQDYEIKQVIQLLEDYVSPKKLLAIHHRNRHNKDDARAIILKLRSMNDPKEAFDYLFAERQKLIDKYRKTTSTTFTYGIEDFLAGSFKKRIDFALSKLSKESITDKAKVNAAANELIVIKSKGIGKDHK